MILDTPEHGNLGDHAIVYALRLFLEERFPTEEIFEFSNEDWYYMRSCLKSAMRKGDVIIIPGGGFIGTLWEREEDILLDIMDALAGYPIIVFPQTVFFSRDKEGMRELSRLRRTVNACKELTIFARDETSYAILKNEVGMRDASCWLVPDIVTYYQPMLHVEREKKILRVLRRDHERVVSEAFSESFTECLTGGRFGEYILTDVSTVLDHKVSKAERAYELHQKLSEFSRAALVITDRLHGMLFAAVTGTPCIALDNASKKVSGQYVWIAYLPYIRQVQADEVSAAFIEEMLSFKEQRYTNAPLTGYYEKMAEIVMHRGKGEAFDE